MTENTQTISLLKRFVVRHRGALSALAAVLLFAVVIAWDQWESAQRQAQENRQIAEHGCTKLPPEAGKPDRILCPGNRIIARPSPVF
ncbi:MULTISPECIES: hypothetical protein [Burkholderiaceae]|uniref:hypothetical protein n=1 Tax=Burkholderiaceae TaxID=119060 RepID=UPI0015F92863|nr:MULTISPECIES: hypothetical protein [Burkholderiaceae]MBA9902256.1 hypothetical protein [Burkholderia cepacia]MBA9949153.1 hypothetical protein [Burkholderia cepacia]MBA9979460.1 hypothetical protein [Burkholderia cepacia]MBA9998299.1 hypothetical protein [Burkholderia cepacia]MBB0006241.1 hypothetical protein [Burkholderia cepacia]